MRPRRSLPRLLGGALVLAAGLVAAGPGEVASRAEGRVVLLVSIDGLRPDVLAAAETPHLDALAARGARALDAETVSPPATVPAHASLLTGVSPRIHGWLRNKEGGSRRFRWPSLLGAIQATGGHVVALFPKEKLRALIPPEDADVLENPGHRARDVGDRAVELLAEGRGGLYVIHFRDVDGEGHGHGWGSAHQRRAVERVDAQIGRLVRHLRIRGHAPRVTWALVSDHGGHGTSHGTGAPGDYAIPIVFSGSGVREDVDLPGRVSLLDVAPTLAKLIGVELPQAPESGQVLAGALVGVEGPPPRPAGAPARELRRRRAQGFGGPR